MNSFFSTLFLIFITLSAHGAMIRVDKINGYVFQDKTGNFQARKLETGSKVDEGFIINTKKDSHARLRFIDNSTLVLGADTNIRIESHEENKATVIYLSKGLIRPKIEKDPSTGEIKKFFVLTPSGIIGVKGTEFLVHYNDKNQKTSVITFKGAVDFAMVDLVKLRRERLYEGEGEKEVVRDDDNTVYLADGGRREAPDGKKIELALKKYNAVVVGPGQFSETVGLIEKTSLPALLSPIQLNILFRNANLNYLYKTSEFQKADLTLRKNKSDISFEVPETPATGVIDLSNKLYAPKAGGFWDMDTGFYIPPGKNSLFLKGAGIFRTEGIGDLDKITGQYIPPLGLKLDDTKGFYKQKLKKNAPQALITRIEQEHKSLQETLHRQIVLGDEDESIYTLGILSKRELISKDVITFTWKFVDHTLTMKNDSFAGDRDYNSDNSMEYSLKWSHSSSRKWQPVFQVSWQTLSYSLDELAGAPQDGERLFKMKLGYSYSMGADWNVSLLGALDQLYFIDHGATPSSGSGTETQMKRVTLPRFYVHFDGELYSKNRWSIDFNGGLMYSLSRSRGLFEVGSGIGYRGELSTKYWWSRKWWLGLGLGRYSESYSISNQNFTSDATQKGSTIGLNIGAVL